MLYKEYRSYGYNLILKKYCKFPWYLPLPAHMEHGWSPLDEPLKSDLAEDKPVMLVFSQRRAKIWAKKSKIPVFTMGAPFILYKKMQRISQKKDARGTVVYPSHSTYFARSRFDIEKYCRFLKKLPKEFQPITICLFWLDYIDKRSDIYRKYDFKVTSAGVKIANSLDFVKKFYKILSSHKYATSNDVGSYTFYAVDLGIPFFLSGKMPTVINRGGRDKNIQEFARSDDFALGVKANELFSTGPITTISTVQRNFVAREMGVGDRLTGKQMNQLMRKYFKENGRWSVIIIYLLSSLFAVIVFNGPWIGLLTRIRKKMTE